MRGAIGVVVGGLLGAIPAGYACAQQAAEPAAASGVISYPSSYYDQFSPASVKDMIEHTPGFTLDKGEDVRGYGGSAGNVLIDGERPASKSVPVDQVLQRMGAQQVVRVDIIRGGAPGIDMQGQSVVANVIRKSGPQSSLALVIAPRIFFNGYNGYVSRLEAAWQAGPMSAEGQVSARRDLASDSGDGGQTRRNAAGSLYEDGDFNSAVKTQQYLAAGSAAYRGGFGAFRLNGSAEYDSSDRHDVAHVRPVATAAFDDHTDIAKRSHDFELGGDFQRPLTATYNLEILGLQRLHHDSLKALTGGRSAAQASDEQGDSGESILRAVIKGEVIKGLALEAGGEAAFNYLDAKSALTIGGVATPLPSANVRVEERRGEAFATGTFKPAPSVTVEAGVRVETSTISQSGGANQEKSFTFAKPRAIATWGIGKFQIRGRVERVVGQLNFKDFAASTELEAGSVNAGNANLEPERYWISEVALEQRFWGSGDIVLTLSHSQIDQVVDLIPINGLFDAPGNIGSGTRDEAKVNITLPLDHFGVTGTQVRIDGAWRRSEVTDPVTGQTRPISGQRAFEGDLTASKSLPSLKSGVGLEAAFGFKETFYRINEIRTNEEQPLLKAYWDWTPRPDLLWRFQIENFTTRERARTREIFIGPRSAGKINYVERRTAKLWPDLVIRLRKPF